MRLMLGVIGALCVLSAHADCVSKSNDVQRLACFDQLAQCLSLSQDDERLACYQQGGLKEPNASSADAALVGITSAAGAGTTAKVEAAYPAPRSAGAVEEAPEIHSSIVAIQKDARGYYYLTLANGHVWREKETVRNRYKEGDQVIISKGALNSNQLRLVNKGRMVRVERYK